MTRWWPVLLLAACTPTLDGDRTGRAKAVGDAVESARVQASVLELVEAHAGDEPLDCSKFDLEEIDQVRRPVCHLTRDKARALVMSRFEALGLSVTTQDDDGPDVATSNVVAEKRGATHPEEVVLVGAHFDAFYAAADDNSSGVAAMLEIARVVSTRSFARTVRFVGFDLEELGLIGSTRYVKSGGGQGVVAGLVFDCIGFASGKEGSQVAPLGLPVPTVGDFIGVIANGDSERIGSELKLLGDRLGWVRTEAVVAPASGAWPLTGDLMRSDHTAGWLTGVPLLFLTDTANFRNPHYHRDTDEPETLDFDFLAGVTRLSAAAVAYWAEVQP